MERRAPARAGACATWAFARTRPATHQPLHPSVDELHARYKVLLVEALGRRGHSVEVRAARGRYPLSCHPARINACGLRAGWPAGARHCGCVRRCRRQPASTPRPKASPLSRPAPAAQWAQAHHGSYPYIAAYTDAAALHVLRKEEEVAAAAAHKMASKDEWVPPPPDEEPETAADYE